MSIAGVTAPLNRIGGAEFRGKAVQIHLDGDKSLIAPLAQTRNNKNAAGQTPVITRPATPDSQSLTV